MNQKVIDTRHRAEQLLAEAVAIWRQSNYSEHLDGLESDPVFSLLMSAVAYQANETEDEIERLKDEVLEEYASMLVPFESAHPIPATACLSVSPQAGVPEVKLDSDSVFKMSGSDFCFTPLLRSRALPARIAAVGRVDGRRWKVALNFDCPVSDLSGFTFAVNNRSYRDLKVTAGGFEIPMVRPWEFSELPFSRCFSLRNSIYNGSEIFDPSTSIMDLFARQDIRVYCVSPHNPSQYIKEDTSSLELVFEFTGVRPDFNFDRSQISLNAVPLANVSIEKASLDSGNPVTRLVADEGEGSTGRFMYLLKPDSSQISAEEKLRVRKVSADRFNQGSLVRLLSSLIGKVHSDYYAFRNLAAGSEKLIYDLADHLEKLRDIASKGNCNVVPGTYLMLADPFSKASISVEYLVTDGGATNGKLDSRTTFDVPGGLDGQSCVMLGEPVPGRDELNAEANPKELVRYLLQTSNRIVTPADIRVFCRRELECRYGIGSDMISSISVTPRIQESSYDTPIACGYEIAVNIVIAESNFVRRTFESIIPKVELLLEKMMQVRSAGIYPIRVSIRIG